MQEVSNPWQCSLTHQINTTDAGYFKLLEPLLLIITCKFFFFPFIALLWGHPFTISLLFSKYKLILVSSTNFSIQNIQKPDLFLDLFASKSANGTGIFTWTQNTPFSINQIWNLVPIWFSLPGIHGRGSYCGGSGMRLSKILYEQRCF